MSLYGLTKQRVKKTDKTLKDKKSKCTYTSIKKTYERSF